MLSWQLQGRLEISSKWKISGLMFRMLRTSKKHNLPGTTYIDTTLRSLQLCPGIILLWFNDAQRAAPNINCEPGAPWPTSSTTSAWNNKTNKTRHSTHTAHMSRRHGRKCGDSVLRRRFMAPATSGLLLLLGMFHKKNNLTRTNHKCKYFSWRG